MIIFFIISTLCLFLCFKICNYVFYACICVDVCTCECSFPRNTEDSKAPEFDYSLF